MPDPDSTGSIAALLVDDDPGDQELTRRSFRKCGLDVNLRVLADGEDALDYLLGRGSYQESGAAPTPDLMLLDLNMPRVGGREVLQAVRADSRLRSIPVVVLSASGEAFDIAHCRALGANDYLTKPITAHDVTELVRRFAPTTLN